MMSNGKWLLCATFRSDEKMFIIMECNSEHEYCGKEPDSDIVDEYDEESENGVL